MSNSSETPVSDNHLYEPILFRATSLKLFVDAFKFIIDKLELDLQAAREDPFISTILGEDNIHQLPVATELARYRRILEILEKKLEEAGDWGSRISLYHRCVRLIKSIVQTYLDELKSRRDEVARTGKISIAVLDAIDSQINVLTEMNRGGVFQNAEPVHLLIDLGREVRHKEKMSVEERNEPAEAMILPTPVYGIKLLDQELLARCFDLVEQFSSQPDRLDTIISEATKILEERIRRYSGADANLSGLDLVTFAFSGNEPSIRLASNNAELEASHLLFRGVFGFIRNPFHHRIVPINRERVIQLLGLIDYLLYLLDNSGRVVS